MYMYTFLVPLGIEKLSSDDALLVSCHMSCSPAGYVPESLARGFCLSMQSRLDWIGMSYREQPRRWHNWG